jgi:hypothetical protein
VQDLLIVALTLACYWAIIKIVKKKNKKTFSKTLYKQSDMHQMLKYFFSLEVKNKIKPVSQLTKRAESDMLKVIVVENQAYWVSNNIFYVAKAFDGEVLTETAKPIDVENMSKKDMDKMLFILDKLKNGKRDDSSSAGNE